jgi:hypothetical protein
LLLLSSLLLLLLMCTLDGTDSAEGCSLSKS